MPPSAAMTAAPRPPRTRPAAAAPLACCALLTLLVGRAAAQTPAYNTVIQMGISEPELTTQRIHFVPDGQCSAQIVSEQMCGGSRPLAVRVDVADAAAFPVVQVLDTLQTVYLFRAAAASGECEGRATVLLLLHCPGPRRA